MGTEGDLFARRWDEFRALFASPIALLAPMEDVSDAVFRAVCRARGAGLCVTEFVNCEGLLRGSVVAARKLAITDDDAPTAIQIYGSDPGRLAEAAQVAQDARPAYVDINCGCWVPKVAGQGAGAGWLREPAAMVAMAARVVQSVKLPVTVKTRIGYGPESHMPIVELAQRLQDAGVAALTVHCRTAQMGHSGKADWSWARRAREVVSIPVVVNGDVNGADEAESALRETGCAAVMIGRRAIDHPWVFREVRARLQGREVVAPSALERVALLREHWDALLAARGERGASGGIRRHVPGYLTGVPGAGQWRRRFGEARTAEAFSLALLALEAREPAGSAGAHEA